MFPELKISGSLLQRFYEEKTIRCKAIRLAKPIDRIDPLRVQALTTMMVSKVKDCIEEGTKIVYVDEAIFSPQTRLTRSWSLKRSNILTRDIRDQLVTHAVLAGISMEEGLEGYLVKPLSINQDSFIEYLHSLRERNGVARLAVFMDNLSVHKTLRVAEIMAELNLVPIFSVPYSPQYNGIESYWFLLKQVYKKDLLHRSAKGLRLSIHDMIHGAVPEVEDSKIKRCAEGGLSQILSDE
jgi:hypothetical protein